MEQKRNGGDVANQSVASLAGSVAKSAHSNSIYSFGTSINEEKREVQHLLESNQSHVAQMAKMLMVVAIPVISQMALSSLNLARSTRVQTSVAGAQLAINNFFLIDDLVTSLQVERGTTASYLSSGGENKEAFTRLVTIRLASDKALAAIQGWPDRGIRIGYSAFQNAEVFLMYLSEFRKQVDLVEVDVETGIRFYSRITQAFMTWAQKEVKLPERGYIWPELVSQIYLMRASDAIGIQRALGSTFTTLCGMDQEGMRWYHALDGEVTSCLAFAFGYSQYTRTEYRAQYIESALQKEIHKQEKQLTDPEFTTACLQNFTYAERFARGDVWFANMTQYMIMVKDIRSQLTRDIYELLQKVTDGQEIEVIAYSVVVAFVTTLCFVLTFWYSAKLHYILTRISNFAKKMASKSSELSYEKKRSEALLSQMLPKAVADQLKNNQEVTAEYFEQVTVMFSDIVGWADLCALSSPIQVVDILNLVYGVFDASIDRYDVYKVETIGDSYMVASGVPYPINHHALEMSHLSLELNVAIKGVAIPHMPGKKLCIRVGMHSGPCTAGVVGLKMPRYCLFGDTVNTSSRMGSTGQADKIQISKFTREHLEGHGGFNTEHRGQVSVKGKGEMDTYFLLGCQGGVCRHALDPLAGTETASPSSTPFPTKSLNFQV